MNFFLNDGGSRQAASFGICQEPLNCRVVGERLKSSLLGHSASHSERLFLPHLGHSPMPVHRSQEGGEPSLRCRISNSSFARVLLDFGG